MNLTQVGIAPPLSPETSVTNGSAQPQQTRQLAQSVQRLNGSALFPSDRELSLSLDPKTKLPVVRVMDTTTHDIIEQVPAEYILSLTASLESEDASEIAPQNPHF